MASFVLLVYFPRSGVRRQFAYASAGTRDQVYRTLKACGLEVQKMGSDLDGV